jgi:hypothetical protein
MVLSFQGAAQHILGACITAARKALINKRFQVGGTFSYMAYFPFPFLS